MIPRKQLDASLADVAAGLWACAGLASPPPERDREGRPLLCARPDSLVCLSVRSGFDLLLSELAWPAGDEVLVTAITIPDMSRILREHGLQPVPVDLDPATLAPELAALERAVTPRTRAVLVAHLFGSRLPLDALIAWAHEHGLQVWEDCAQAFTADGFEGHAAADVRMFSFGTIKTATAFGSGILLVSDGALRSRLQERHLRWPEQPAGSYAKKLLKLGSFLLLQTPWVYGAVFRLIRWLGRDPDQVIMDFGRGFAGGDFFAKLRLRPAAALQHLLARRLRAADPAHVQSRAAAGEFLLAQLRVTKPLGSKAAHRTHWLFPLRVKNADALLPVLWRAGFDATRASSSLHALPDGGGGRAPRAQAAMSEVVYVPAYAAMGEHRLAKLTALLNAHAEPAE
jgi:dTDP-4-amino-4,6-dideoxygalactose transaminase